MKNIIGEAIGRAAARVTGMTAMYLPEGVSYDFATAIVSAANKERDLDETQANEPSYAILVSANPLAVHVDNCPVVNSNESLMYRKDDRLVVLYNSPTELASFDNSTRVGMSQNYPEVEGTLLRKAEFSRGITKVIFEECGLNDVNSANTRIISDEICSVLKILHFIHRDATDTDKWNVSWITNVEIGLQNLVKVIKRFSGEESGITFSDLNSWIYPAFGLPLRQTGQDEAKSAKDIIQSLRHNWSSSEQGKVSSIRLANHPETLGDKHDLSFLGWEKFDRFIAQESNLLSGFREFIQKFNATDLLHNTSHDQFINPDRQQKNLEPPYLSPVDSRGFIARENSVNLIQTAIRASDGKFLEFESNQFELVIPLQADVSVPAAAEDSLVVGIVGGKCTWIQEKAFISDSSIKLVGRFRGKSRGSVHETFFPIQSLIVTTADARLHDYCNLSATVPVLIFPPNTDALALFVNNKKGLRKTLVAGSTCFDHMKQEFADDSPYSIDLPRSSSKNVVVVQSPSYTPICNGVAMNPLEDCEDLYSANVSVSGPSTVSIGSKNYDLLVSVQSNEHESPVIAAATNAVATSSLPDGLSDSLCARYEDVIVRSQDHGIGLGNLGHIFLPQTESYEFGAFVENDKSAAYTTAGINEKLARNPHLRVDPRVLESPELARFSTAYRELGVNEHCRRDADTGVNYAIPSKCSWRHLVAGDRRAIDEYVDAYTRLVELASSLNDPFTKFWASYPLSFSIWDDTKSFLTCSAVYLSPLHPLRLQWIAEVEDVLWKSSLGTQLIGAVEGWNLPITGSGESENSRFIASPIDSGPGQVFIGWSMLVPIQNGRPEVPQAVTRSGMYAAPGSSVGGINGQVTKSALRTFRRITPHLSTLVVDIASITKGQRLPELDMSLLSTVKDWIADEVAPLSGGIRVHDSSNRLGHPPITALEKLIDEHPDVPITWRRYDDQQSMAGVKTNVRILNDAASHISYSENVDTALGAIANLPLKRLVVSTQSENLSHQTSVYPLVGQASVKSPYGRALAAVESNGRGFALKSQLSPEILESKTADWTIAGEAFTSPGALVSMLQNDGATERMLWEWRPPFLSSKVAAKDITIQDRPYISISRVSQLFRSDLSNLVSKALGTKTTDKIVDSVLSTLGARGIGLSTLLSVGGSQTAGAIGFYVTLEMSKHLEASGDPIFILPIDSCDGFLQKLAGEDNASELTRRADLLVIRFASENIVLSPIEIKCFGLVGEHENTSLPGADDAVLADAKSQIASTSKLLQKLCSNWDDISTSENEADKALWANGFASLLEAASKIQPMPAHLAARVQKRIQRVVDGELNLVVGKGIINYYSRLGVGRQAAAYSDPSASSGYKITSDSHRDWVLLTAEIGHALSSAANSSSRLCTDWVSLVKFATHVDEQKSDQTTIEWSSLGNELVTETIGESLDEVFDTPVLDPVTPKPVLTETVDPDKSELKSDMNDGVIFEVGTLMDSLGPTRALYAPSDTRLNQMNIGVVGDLGTGKTQMLRTIVSKVREESKKAQNESASFLIFDYKGDYLDEEFIDRVGGVVLEPVNMPLNVFARPTTSNPNPRRISMEFFDVISKIYKGVGPVQRQKFGEAALAAFAVSSGQAPTLGEVLEQYMMDGKADSVSSILSDFVHGNIFTEDKSLVATFDDLMKESVIVVNLNALGTDQTMKNAIVVLFLNLYYDYMKRTKKIAPHPGVDVPSVRTISSYLLVDEANNIMKYDFDVLQQLLLESREFGFGVILSSQFLSHFSNAGKNYAEPLNTWFIHKVPDVSAKQLSQLGLPHADTETADRIKNLDNLCSYYSSFQFRGRFIRDNSYYKLYNLEKKKD